MEQVTRHHKITYAFIYMVWVDWICQPGMIEMRQKMRLIHNFIATLTEAAIDIINKVKFIKDCLIICGMIKPNLFKTEVVRLI